MAKYPLNQESRQRGEYVSNAKKMYREVAIELGSHDERVGEDAVKAVINAIAGRLRKRKPVVFVGFGTFTIKKRKGQYMGGGPGKPLKWIENVWIVRFKSAVKFKKYINW